MTVKERLELPAEKWGRVNLRAYLKRRLQEEGISGYALAKALGVHQPNLARGLNEKATMPLARIEQILWLVDGENGNLSGDFAKKVAEELKKLER